ncbi:MAG: tRNA (N(6)-L-threonylcarbamoyladenosine(37)-C(2))-methylthiotransferase MtaB [Candidatus Binatia bacterium]
MGSRVALHTLGCKVNTYDTATIADRLRAAGCTIVGATEPADVVIVNSCTVTDAADAESRRLARRARHDNPGARVILTGCYAQTRPAHAAGVGAVDHVIGLGRVDAIIAAATAPAAGPAPARIEVGAIRAERVVGTVGARTFDGQTRAFLKVQEGCDLFCTFCIIPMARGRSRSLGPRAVLDEIGALARAGFREVVLTGVHLGGYGADLTPRRDLCDLIEIVAERGLVPRLRLSSIDPHEVSERLIRLLRDLPSLCPHLHVPLQAGDDAVLRRMRRRNDVALAGERLAMIRELLPDAAIGSDLIAGFPGEDEAAFDRTAAFVAASPLTYFHVFPYSVRNGTTAAKLDGHVAPPVIAARARQLRQIGERKHAAFAVAFDGAEADVLVESTRDPRTGALRGYTRHYLRARLDGPDAWMGDIVPVRLAVTPSGRVEARAAG